MIVLSQLLIAWCLASYAIAEETFDGYLNTNKDASGLLQKLVDHGGSIRLPDGSLRIERTITLHLTDSGYVSIHGTSASKIVMAGNGPAFRIEGTHFKSADPEDFAAQIWDRERMPMLTGFAITGEHPSADGIEAVGTMQLTLSHLHLSKLGDAVRLIENNRNLQIDNCHIYENRGCGVLYDRVNLHQSNIIGCHISYCNGGGIVCRGGNVRNIHITGCDIESNMSASSPATANVLIDCRESDYGTGEVAITGCTIQHNDAGTDSCNIHIIGRSDSSATQTIVREGNVTITGNILSDVMTNVHLEECRGVVLTGNTFWMGYRHNLLVERCSNIIVGANNMDRNPRYDYGNCADFNNAVAFDDCEDCTIAGLHLSSVWRSEAGLLVQNCKRMHLNGLTVLDCDNVGIKLNNVSQSRLANCMISDTRADSTSVPLIVEGGQDNRIDE